MSETEDDDSDGGHGFDDDEYSNGDNNVEDDPGSSTSDSDAVKEISSSAWYLTINWWLVQKQYNIQLLYKFGCRSNNCTPWVLDIICFLVKHDIKASLYHHSGSISCDPLSFPVIFFITHGRIQKIQKEEAEFPTLPCSQMKTLLFRACNIQNCERIRDAKFSNVNISEDRIKEHL